MRGVKRHKLRGERWEIEKKRLGKGGWNVLIGKVKKSAKKKWKWGREERRKDWEVTVSDAGEEDEGMGMGES